MTRLAAHTLLADTLAAKIEGSATTKRQQTAAAELATDRAYLADLATWGARDIALFNAANGDMTYLARFSRVDGAWRLGRDPYKPGVSAAYVMEREMGAGRRGAALTWDPAQVAALADGLAAAFLADK